MWYIARESNFSNSNDRIGSVLPKRSDQIKSPEGRLRAIATETRNLVGTIEQVTVLRSEKTRFLKIRAFVIDRDKLSGVDFSVPSQELPTVEEVFDVAVNEKTNIKGGKDIDSIQSGDFVSVTTAENIFDAKQLTAESIERLRGASSAYSEKKNK